MKKALITLLLCAVSIICGAQPFIDSPNYIYGVGMGLNETYADSVALQAFAKAVGVSIKNDVDYAVRETNGVITRDYRKNVGASSSYYIEGLKRYSTREATTFIVYYYIDKERYINERMSAYEQYMEAADSVMGTSHPHADNLALGYLYHAYITLDSNLLNAIHPHSQLLKDSLYEHMRDYYGSLSIRKGKRGKYYFQKNDISRGYIMINEFNCKKLPGFEYLSSDGVWVQPTAFYTLFGQHCNMMEAVQATVERTNYEFRFIYEEYINNRLVKIPVPDEFYFYLFKFLG